MYASPWTAGNYCGARLLRGQPARLRRRRVPRRLYLRGQRGGSKQCQPESLSCACLPGDDGETRTCVDSNGFGQCFGNQTCNSTLGLDDVHSRDPPRSKSVTVSTTIAMASKTTSAAAGDACTNSNANGICSGILDCVAGQGTTLACTAAVPAARKLRLRRQ